ncbi:hypothetical protein OS493_000319 [Desmophyllum pertusum]|uniref:F-box domain-containing protein n=1 Tax=Desmophyllum pertusum TaxID=174260 RepID=A0A9X0A7P0_9CNID|nr:hypothetical protein OS493_000319 [Desmophyllum pertusum]
MEILPDDIWLEIFTFLPQKDLLRTALVCRTWNRLSRDSSLWSCLDLEPFAKSLTDHVISRLINTMFAPLGKHLSLNKNLVTTTILQGLFERCCRLESLSLNDCRFHSAGPWYELRLDQVETLTFLDLRNSSGFASGVEDILRQAYNLKYLGLHCCISPRLLVRIFITKHNLRIVDCTQCDWLTDDSIQTIAENSPFLESICVAKCRNVQGRTLPTLLEICPRLKTLILEGTQIQDEYVRRVDWVETNITELNVLSCYRLSFAGLSEVLPKLKRLRYLKCALTDEILRMIVDGFPLLEVFFLHRRYPVTVQCVSDLLFHCPSVTCLDISSIPLAFVYFESFLPCMPRLRLLSFAESRPEFYVCIRKKDGSFFKVSSLKVIRAAVYRFLKSAPNNKPGSIISDPQFKQANDALDAFTNRSDEKEKSDNKRADRNVI